MTKTCSSRSLLPRSEPQFLPLLEKKSYPPRNDWLIPSPLFQVEDADLFGGPCRGRTYGPLIKSQLLYQLSSRPTGGFNFSYLHWREVFAVLVRLTGFEPVALSSGG